MDGVVYEYYCRATIKTSSLACCSQQPPDVGVADKQLRRKPKPWIHCNDMEWYSLNEVEWYPQGEAFQVCTHDSELSCTTSFAKTENRKPKTENRKRERREPGKSASIWKGIGAVFRRMNQSKWTPSFYIPLHKTNPEPSIGPTWSKLDRNLVGKTWETWERQNVHGGW